MNFGINMLMMVDSHREQWVRFSFNAFKKPYDADRAQVRKIFDNTSTPEQAETRIKSYFKAGAIAGWRAALTTVWSSTGKATIAYMHEFHTGKSVKQEGDDTLDIPEVDQLTQTWDAYVQRYLYTAGDKITNITDTTQDKITQIIADGVANGDSHYVIGQAIDDQLGDSWEGRGMTISRTEANGAMNRATQQDMKATVPDMWKTWSTTGMDNVREWHQDADGQSVPQDQPFDVMGEDLDCPGDDSGSPENVINCACCMLADPAPEESRH